MPWGMRKPTKAACKVARAQSAVASILPREILAACQAAGRFGLPTQGIGLRPQLWAGLSRPVGPEGLPVEILCESIVFQNRF